MNDEETIRALQQALAFWLPRVPDEDSARADRIAADSYLLIGHMPPYESTAQDLGWIKLT